METHTILEIIKMINLKRKQAKEKLKAIPQYNQDETQYWTGLIDGYFDLYQHLQSYIEEPIENEEYHEKGHCPNCGGLIDLHGPKCAGE